MKVCAVRCTDMVRTCKGANWEILKHSLDLCTTVKLGYKEITILEYLPRYNVSEGNGMKRCALYKSVLAISKFVIAKYYCITPV